RFSRDWSSDVCSSDLRHVLRRVINPLREQRDGDAQHNHEPKAPPPARCRRNVAPSPSPHGEPRLVFASDYNHDGTLLTHPAGAPRQAGRYECSGACRKRILTRLMSPKSNRLLIGLAALAVLAAGFMLLREWRGPAVPGYRVEAQPLVQTVVAAGRVIGVSRVQVGSEITGVVVERRVEEGDEVVPGDVLVVLRADDLAARVREAEAALAQLERSARPRSEVALREAEA